MTITCVVEAHKEQEVALFDIPGAHLHKLTDEEVIIMLKGHLAELMVMLDPTF